MRLPGVYIEIGQSSLKALDGDRGLELPLEPLENGRLTNACRERLTLSLQGFLKHASWHPRRRALCAISARGVSLRTLTLPAATDEETQRLLRLQIESLFPLAPEELAWGSRPLNPAGLPRRQPTASREVLVAAVKKEAIQEYSELLAGCGLNPVFTLGALARSALCAQQPGSYAMLDVGRNHSELMSFENGVPGSVRILPWGGEHLTRAIEDGLGISRDEAEKLKIDLGRDAVPAGEPGQKLERALQQELDSLGGFVRDNWKGPLLYLTGGGARLKALAPGLAERLGDNVTCQPIEVAPGDGRSAAILGLKESEEKEGACPPLILRVSGAGNGERVAGPAQFKWVALAVLLALACVLFPYAEALILKPGLARKLAEIRAAKDRLSTIDRELSLLQFVKTNQPPYLETLVGLANASPPGARVESLSMNRRGDLSFRGTLGNPQIAVEFRSNLVASGIFSTLVVEEQTPTPNQQVVMRIAAQWKATSGRSASTNEPPPQPSGKQPRGGPAVKAGAPQTTNAPGTNAPGTNAPGTNAPGTNAPGTNAPGTNAPGTNAPGTNAPGTNTPGRATLPPAPTRKDTNAALHAEAK